MKDIRIRKCLSVILVLSMMISMFAGVGYGDTATKKISVRIEGAYETILDEKDYETKKETVYEAVYDLLQEKGISLVIKDSAYGKYVSSVKGESEGSFGGYDGWQYLMNGMSAYNSIDTSEINNEDEIVFYYGEFDTYIPVIELPPDPIEAGDEFTIRITSYYDVYDDNWEYIGTEKINIKEAKIELDEKAYYTDENGEAFIFAPEAAKTYEMKISKNRENNYPELVRTAIELKVEEPKVSTPEKQLKRNLNFTYKGLKNPKYGDEWTIMTLGRGNHKASKDYYKEYYDSVATKLKEKDGNLGNAYADYSKLILALTAIGKDVTDVSGYNLLEKLADYNKVTNQGVIGASYALLALDSYDYEIPKVSNIEVQTTRDALIEFILNKEINSGTANAKGWALSGNTPDVDVTSYAIQALAPYYLSPYYNKNTEVKAAVDRGTAWLSNIQMPNGGFPETAWTKANSQNIAQVIVALTELGINPDTDNMFIKNKKSLIDALMGFAVAEGGFKNLTTEIKANAMATVQGTYALVAYDRLKNNKNSLYDMTDVQNIEKPLPEGEKPKVEIPLDDKEYKVPISDTDIDKEIEIVIPENKNSKVFVELPKNKALPEIKATKGDISMEIPKGAIVTSGEPSALELISSKSKDDATVKSKVSDAIPSDKKLENIHQVFAMGSGSKVVFSEFVTLTFKGLKGKEAAYIQGNTLVKITKYSNDNEGKADGKDEYAYDSGNDLIVKTKHFTDFIAYSISNKSSSGDTGGGSGSGSGGKSYATLSIDKKAIGGGVVLTSTKVEILSGDTVWSLTKRVMDNKGIKYDDSGSDNIYVKSIDGVGEFDHGPTSGWMYSLNGKYSLDGSNQKKLKNGDVIKWSYTTNLGEDLGEDNSKWESNTGGGSSGGTIGGGTVLSGIGTVMDTEAGQTSDIKDKTETIDIEKKYQDAGEISSWAMDSIKRATEKGFVTGSDGKLNPKGNISRAEFTKIMTAVLNLDTKIDNTIEFNDVKADEWFYPYINAAFKAGIIAGSGESFNPRGGITREQMAVIIVRALKLKPEKIDITIKDLEKVSAWAKAEVEMVVALGLMVGNDNVFDPSAPATKEMATVIAMRIYDYLNDLQNK